MSFDLEVFRAADVEWWTARMETVKKVDKKGKVTGSKEMFYVRCCVTDDDGDIRTMVLCAATIVDGDVMAQFNNVMTDAQPSMTIVEHDIKIKKRGDKIVLRLEHATEGTQKLSLPLDCYAEGDKYDERVEEFIHTY